MEYTNEASVQELATSASFIKDLVGEIKNVIKNAQACASAPAREYQKTETARDRVAEKAVEEVKEEDKIANIWNRIMKILPDTFVKSGVGQYKYQKPEEPKPVKKGKGTFSSEEEEVVPYKSKEKIMEAELELTDHIEFKVYNPTGQSVTIFVHSAGINRYGVNPSLYDEFIESLGCDEATKRFVAEMIDCK